MSFQTEERYWTDYLRVILPVVGLLLLLGLFWFWASSLIGDDSETPATPSQVAIVVTDNTPTPTETVQAQIDPVETTETDEGDTGNGGETGDNGAENGDAAEPTPTEEADEEPVESTGGIFEVDDLVAVTDDNVRLRSDPTTDSEIVETLNTGDQLRITGGPEEDDLYVWWPVDNEASGESGWVVEDFLEPSE